MTEKMKRDYSATSEGRDYLRLLASNSKESSSNSKFNDMVDAYRALFTYGILKGKRLKPEKPFIGIGQFTMLMGNYDFSVLIHTFGKKEDLSDIGNSINEYTNWAIEEMRKTYPKGNMTIEDIKKLMDD